MLKLYNAAPCPWKGWVPFTVPDSVPLPPNGLWRVQGDRGTDRMMTVVRGEQLGRITCAWIELECQSDEAVHADLALQHMDATEVVIKEGTELPPLEGGSIEYLDEDLLPDAPNPLAQIPPHVLADPAGAIGCSINGIVLEQVPGASGALIEVDGPALRSHGRALVGSAVWADIFIAWVPTEAWLRFELVFTCAHPNRSPMIVEGPLPGFDLRIGNMLVAYHGARMGAVLRGERIAQGQARSFSGIAAWLTMLSEDQKRQLVTGAMQGGPFAIETEWKTQAGGLGVPDAQNGFNVDTWIRQQWGGAMQQQWSTTPTTELGVAWNSGVTGAQEDQCFSANGGEAFAAHRTAPAAVFIRYQAALLASRRPCHWREADGKLLDWDAHPNLRMWGGCPHYSADVSPDRLGLSRIPGTMDTGGWSGPDREHFFYGSLWFAAAVTGSRALQMECEALARVVWFSETVQPGLSTSHVDASRSVGWFGILIRALASTMGDGASVTRMVMRALDRVTTVYKHELPRKNAHGVTVWDSRPDPRLLVDLAPTYPSAWMVWQQSIGAFGLYLLGKMLDDEEAMSMAVDAARTCFEQGWRDGIEWEVLGSTADGSPLPVDQYGEGMGAHRTGWFRHAWMPLAIAVLEAEGDAQASTLMAQLRSEAQMGNGMMAWLPPVGRLTQ